MKHLININGINESIENLLPPDGSYKRIYHNEYAILENTYDYVHTDVIKEMFSLKFKSLHKNIEKWDNENWDMRVRTSHRTVSYKTKNYSDVFIVFEAREDDWFFIEISYPSDSFRFIADGESGLDAFIADFDPSDPLQENKDVINESISFPDDGNYLLVDHEGFKEFMYQYEAIRDIDKRNVFFDIITSYFKEKNIYVELTNVPDNMRFLYGNYYYSMSIELRSDDWVGIITTKQSGLELYICDGEVGLYNFIVDFVMNVYDKSNENIINESINYPNDESYIQIDDNSLREIRSQYKPSYSFNYEVFDKIKDKLYTLNIKPFNNGGAHCLQFYNFDNRLTTIELESLNDDWMIMHIRLPGNWKYYFCDGDGGVSKLIDEIDFSSSSINESIIYPSDGSFRLISSVEFGEIIQTYEFSRINISELLEFIIRLNDKYGTTHKIGDSKITMTGSNSFFEEISVCLYSLEDNWFTISITTYDKKVYDTKCYLCDDLLGIDAFLNSGDLKPLTESIKYPEDGSFVEINSEEMFDFLFNYSNQNGKPIAAECAQKTIKYLTDNGFIILDFSVNSLGHNISTEKGNLYNLISIASHDDDWILVNSYQGTYICDQLVGFIELLETGILIQTNLRLENIKQKENYIMINESFEHEIEDGSYVELSDEETVYIWKQYKPKDFDSYDMSQLTKHLSKDYSININPDKKFTITIYSYKEKILFGINKLNDGWFIVNDHVEGHYLCEQIDGLINFMGV
jgi:hypothetical protein